MSAGGGSSVELARIAGAVAVDVSLIGVIALLAVRGSIATEAVIAILSTLAGGAVLRRPTGGIGVPGGGAATGIVLGMIGSVVGRLTPPGSA